LSSCHSEKAVVEVDIQVDDRFAPEVDAALIERAVAAALAAEGVVELVEVGVLVADDAALHTLNRDYRGVDATTDVLSFGDEDDDSPGAAFVRPPDAPRYLGDLAISYERVVAQAAEYGHARERELAYLTVHGILHLLGHDHERGEEDAAAMRAREEAVMQQIGLTRE